MSPPLRLELLGRCIAHVGDRTVRPNAERVFAGLLLLGLERGRRWSRTEFAELLWPDADESVRLARLRWFLNKVRTLGLAIEPETTELVLARKSVTIDVDDAAPDAGERVHDVLPGYHPDFSPTFSTWLAHQRDALEATLLLRLEANLNAAKQKRDWPATLAAAAALRALDADNEEAVIAAAEAHSRLGRRGEAIATLRRYLSGHVEHGLEVQVRARALIRRLESAPESETIGEPAFVGRVDQLRRIDSVLAGAKQGQGGALILTGPAGIGKTRLLDEARVLASIAGIRTVRIRCNREDVHRPLSGIADLIPQLLEQRGAAGASPDNLARLRKFTVASPEDEPARDERASADLVRAQLVAALIDVLGAVSAEGPIQLQLDDVQWVDQSLGWLWRDLLRWSENHAVAWLFGFRTSRRDAPTLDAPVVPVGALEVTYARDLLNDLAAKASVPLPDDVCDAIAARGAGSPLFMAELVRQWSTTGSVETLPSSLASLVERGLGSLSAPALRTLQVAAILGAYASLERIEQVGALARATFVEGLVELDAAGILAADRSGHVFGHVLWAEAALSRLSPSVATVLHTHAAERFDAELKENADALLLWESARHWNDAGQRDRARGATLRGAEHLVEHGFMLDAATAYARAIAMTGDAKEQLRILKLRIRALYLAGNWPEAIREIDHHERLAAELDPVYNRHNDLELLRMEMQEVELTAGPVMLRSAMACAHDPASDPAHRMRAVRAAAKFADLVAPELLNDLVVVARQFPATQGPENWDRLRVLYIWERRFGDVRNMVAIGEELVDHSRRSTPSDLAGAIHFLGQALVVAGRFQEARAAYEEALAMATRGGALSAAGFFHDHIIGLSLEMDPPAATRAAIERARETFVSLGAIGMRISLNVALRGHEATLAVTEGRYEDALALSLPLEDCFANVSPRLRARLLAHHLGSHLGLGREDRIDEMADAMVAGFETPDDWLDWPASIYAQYLEHRHGAKAAQEFAARFVNEIRRELYPAPARLRELAAAHASVANV